MSASMNRPLHIAHVLLSLQPGGLENGVVNVVNGLDPAQFRSSLCCLQQAGEFATRIRDRSVRIEAMGLKPGNDLRLPFRLARLFRQWKVDIVHTRNAEAFFYGVLGARLAGVPAVIHSEHGRTFPESPRRALLQRLLWGRADFKFAVSNQLRKDMIREIRVSPAHFEVLYNGVDIERFKADRTTPQRNEIVIGSVGRLVQVKNYPLLLKAMARLPAGTRARLVLVGEGPERGTLERTIAELGLGDRAQLLGHREDVSDLLRGMDIFVLPSFSEGMSNTLLEAMAAGVASLASNVGGNGEIIEDELSGLLFPSGDIDRAAEQLTRLVADAELRVRLAHAGAARVRKEFSIEAMLRRYTLLYRHVWSQVHGEPVSSVAY
jgi:sugar transferase (PEP-CTERM/EpsH1 system associated)